MAALYVFIGGGLGSLCRYGLSLAMTDHGFKLPLATVTANILAGFVLGVIAGWTMKHAANEHIILLGAVGFCGGFSTFSTFSLENVQLWQDGHYGTMILNILISVILCFGSVFLGLKVAELVP